MTTITEAREAIRVLEKERANIMKDGISPTEAAYVFAWIDSQLAFYRALAKIEDARPPA